MITAAVFGLRPGPRHSCGVAFGDRRRHAIISGSTLARARVVASRSISPSGRANAASPHPRRRADWAGLGSVPVRDPCRGIDILACAVRREATSPLERTCWPGADSDTHGVNDPVGRPRDADARETGVVHAMLSPSVVIAGSTAGRQRAPPIEGAWDGARPGSDALPTSCALDVDRARVGDGAASCVGVAAAGRDDLRSRGRPVRSSPDGCQSGDVDER